MCDWKQVALLQEDKYGIVWLIKEQTLLAPNAFRITALYVPALKCTKFGNIHGEETVDDVRRNLDCMGPNGSIFSSHISRFDVLSCW